MATITAGTKVSVIVPTYRSGPELDRLVASLDAQTMPRDEFEVVFADDGSPDGTYARLLEIASSRPWVRAFRFEPSGWPSRPRNLAVERAAGEYVVFADHDDTLFPDALRSAYAFAVEHDLDVVNAKEVRTNRPAWGLSVYDGNRVWARDDAPADALSPMTPHKLYRRALLLEHGIRFPERAHHMWEDNLFNVDVFVAARRIGVLGDVPFYHWQRGHPSSSSSYGTDPVEYWQSVAVVLDHIRRRVDDPALRDTRDAMLADKMKVRVLGQFGPGYLRRNQQDARFALDRARELLDAYFPPDLDHLLDARDQARAALVRAGEHELLERMVRLEASVVGKATATSLAWSGSTLTVTGAVSWTTEGDAPLPFRRTGGPRAPRLERVLPERLAGALGPLTDWTGVARAATVRLIVRHREERTSWWVPTTSELHVVDDATPDGVSTLRLEWSATFDVDTLAGGRPLEDGVWDAIAEVSLGGFCNRRGLWARFTSLPALLRGRPALAYSNRAGRLSLDVGQRIFPLVSRARVDWGAARTHREPDGSVAFRVPVGHVHTLGDAELRGTLELTPAWTARSGWRHGLSRWSPAWLRHREGWDRSAVRLVSDDDGVHLDGTLTPPRHTSAPRLTFGGRTYRTGRELRQTPDGIRFDARR